VSHVVEVDLAVYALAPESLTEEQRTQIAAHLAECAACQGTHDFFAVSEEVLAEELRDATTWEPLLGSETQRVLMEYGALVAQEDGEAAELLKDYLASPITVAWQTLVTRRRFRTAGVVRALIRAAQAIRENDPLAALTFAENAIAIAEGLDDERYPDAAVDQLRATAWKEQANAQMFLGRLPQAHVSLDSAERYHRRYVPNGLGLSITAFVRAGVFYEQSRLDEAIVCAQHAELGYAHAGQEKRRMDAVFLRASILFEAGRTAEAIPLFRYTIDYGEEVGNLRLIARGCYAIGNCEVDLGNLGEASIHFRRALVIFRDVGPETARIATEWGIARVVLHGRKYEEAIRRLRDVATEFERLQMLTNAALVGLDIVEALLALGQTRRIVALAQHLAVVFTQAGKLTGALSAMAYLKEAAATHTLAVSHLREIRTFLRKAELQPNLQFLRPTSEESV
jgi:tetratricopeptide (TPR) repeat protein